MSALSPLPILPPPGVVLTETERVAEGRWIGLMNIRFVKALPQKLAGNVRAVVTPTSGVPRSMHAWRDNSQNNYLAAGTYRKLYVYDESFAQNDITPYRAVGTLGNNPFSTTNGSNVVKVSQTLHGLNTGDTVVFSGSSAVGGINPNGTWLVDLVVNANQFTFIALTNATSTASGGGAAVAYSYEVPVGVEFGIYGLGYGAGAYGIGTYGTPRDSSTIYIEPRIWALHHFGKLLIASYNGGSIYKFDPTQLKPWPRAVLLSSDPGLPTNVRYSFVTPERFIVALLGSMQLAWCSQGDPDTWTPAIGNTANIRTLTEGTKLVAGASLSDFISLVWTDAALYRMQYTGSTYIYNTSMIATDCGLISPNGQVNAGGIAYWIGQDTFWIYNGSVMPMPNVEDIRKYFFDQLRIDYGYQCNAIFVPQHNEIWFFVTIQGQQNPTVGVIYSIENQCWAPLTFGRTSGAHFTQGDTRPFMGSADGYIYQHETGYDDNGAIMPVSLQLSPYTLSEGGTHMDVESFSPDFLQQTGNITLTLTSYNRLNDSLPEDTDMAVIPPMDGDMEDMRMSGRYVGLLIEQSSLGCYFRWGKPVAWIKPSGKR